MTFLLRSDRFKRQSVSLTAVNACASGERSCNTTSISTCLRLKKLNWEYPNG